MGNMTSLGMAGAVAEGQITLEAALEFHLRSNHFPPVDLAWLPVCEQAITLANAGEWDAVIDAGARTSTVAEICDGLHLHAFIEYGEEG